ncbi:hypothetical protein [Wolbachia endosymbiont of Folsomia candida]|uniref:hypothetical protein n=1 Tax=Wolbachia endosymbiont of Folsomia candida TaxID=169402 RepID=UPI000AFF8410|nr:hypothetical protein [Wolbachia endosymbiont of Folsomia candida]APR97776.1 hypothetical protein ASM33_00235 [Wolbachia endosymbiont of Folsomia candida]
MIDLNEFLHIQDFFEEGGDHFMCLKREGPNSFRTCMSAKVKHGESDKLEFGHGITLDLTSWTIEDDNFGNPKKYTIDKSKSWYQGENNLGSYITHEGLILKTVPISADRSVTELRTVTLRKI